jgi:hypothetical protein
MQKLISPPLGGGGDEDEWEQATKAAKQEIFHMESKVKSNGAEGDTTL